MAAHQAPVLGILQARILEWVAISFSSAWKWEVKVKSFSCVQCFATPWPVAYQAPPSMGVPRQEYWSGVPLPSPQGRRREVLFKMSLGEGGWATIHMGVGAVITGAWPCGPLRSKGLRRKGQSCGLSGLSGRSKLSVECRLGSLDPSHALSFPQPAESVTHPHPRDLVWGGSLEDTPRWKWVRPGSNICHSIVPLFWISFVHLQALKPGQQFWVLAEHSRKPV